MNHLFQRGLELPDVVVVAVEVVVEHLELEAAVPVAVAHLAGADLNRLPLGVGVVLEEKLSIDSVGEKALDQKDCSQKEYRAPHNDWQWMVLVKERDELRNNCRLPFIGHALYKLFLRTALLNKEANTNDYRWPAERLLLFKRPCTRPFIHSHTVLINPP